MNMKTMSNRILGCLLCMATLGAMAAEPTISDVVVKQRWPWSRLVDIDYMLTCDPGERVDITLTAKDGPAPLALPLNSLTGDLYILTPGQKRIVWDPTVTSYTNKLTLTQFNVDLTPTEPPLYMIIDLTKSAGASGQIEYVTEADLTNGLWGAWVRDPVTNRGTVVHSVIWTGVTTNEIYKTDKLVLRRVPAGSFYEGDDDGTKTANVTLTKDLYAGVFEVTQQQWNRVMTGGTGTDAKAKHTVSYYDIRENPSGDSSDDPDVNWPSNKLVNAASFMGKLRAMTGINEFDLPTEAQWEYTCKAKTTTVFNDGITNAMYTGTAENNNGNTNLYLNVLGWYLYGVPKPAAAQVVGGNLPNAWGLYDTHGNVWEWCLDWSGTAGIGTDPVGPASGSDRMRRGGSWTAPASYCRSAFRSSGIPPSTRLAGCGFRLVRTLP